MLKHAARSACGEFKIEGLKMGKLMRAARRQNSSFHAPIFFSTPTTHATIVTLNAVFGHHEVLVDADDHAETLATLAGAEGIEGKTCYRSVR